MNAASIPDTPAPVGSFRQDVATFYAIPRQIADEFASDIYLDGAEHQKVLKVACPQSNIVIVECADGQFTFEVSSGRWNRLTASILLDTQVEPLLITQEDGLPVENIRCHVQAKDGVLWVGSARGVARLREGVWRYFAGKRWLPDDRVNGIALDECERAWIATDGGLVCLESRRMTWLEKAAHYEAITAARHNRDGYVTECLLTVPGDLSSSRYEASDNDGLWTALYVCAECFRWAVTGDPEARTLARKSMDAMLALVRVTGIPGFPARALLRRGESAYKSEPLANWTTSPVDPDTLYKGDTSSDEIDGHYLAWYVYHRFVADEEEKQEIAATCRGVTDHLLNHHYTLVGPTGKRTSWGVWSPEVLNGDPDWEAERGLNSLEILSHLRVAMHLCPDTRYLEAYNHLITQHHYALNTVRQKIVPPRGEINYSDDELAACAYYPLLQLETEGPLRALYLLSLERTHAVLRLQQSPFYNTLYSACTQRACDMAAATTWLAEAPLDLRDWTMRNSHRPDVVLAGEVDRFGKRQTALPLPPSEIGVMKWNRNPYLADWEGEGLREMDGAFWLLPYWMGRYYQLIVE